MARCVYCGKDRGKRECPALGGLISPSCCGQNRGIRINCPPDCRYFVEHEEYQRERLAPDFHAAWLEHIEPLYRERRVEALDFLAFVEISVYQYFLRETQGTDEDLVEGLEHVSRKLSPIQVIEAPGSRLGQHLWQAVESLNREGRGVDPEEGQEAVAALIKAVKALAEDGEPRQALQGLLGHVEQYLGVPEGLEEREAGAIETPRIVYPGQP